MTHRPFSDLWKPTLKPYEGHADQLCGPITYSHCGVDLLLLALSHFMGITNPRWLDVGAHHPFNISNTALLYNRGFRGVNIEANPNLIKNFYDMRPEDINVNIGVAPQKGTMKFYMWDDFSGRNTFSEAASKQLQVLTKEIELPVDTLNNIVDLYCDGKFPDILLMDIEGLDHEVLSITDFSKSRPKIICVESSMQETEKFNELLKSKGYSFTARLSADLVYIDNNYKQLCGVP